jgi:hypothetical protein
MKYTVNGANRSHSNLVCIRSQELAEDELV